jgi:hypothetical protein
MHHRHLGSELARALEPFYGFEGGTCLALISMPDL